MQPRTRLTGRQSRLSADCCNVDNQFIGEALLADNFEVGAWQGRATSSVCHWIRGFLSGAASSLAGHALRVSEPECQAKGDPHCRMVFQRA